MRALATTGSGIRLADSDAPTVSVRGAAGEGAAVASASSAPRKASLRMGGILHGASAMKGAVLSPKSS